MEHEEITDLVLNLIEASKKIVDNYDFYHEEDSDGMVEDHCAALINLNAFSTYYAGNKTSLDTILAGLHSYYEPHVAVYDHENPEIKRARKIYRLCFPAATISTLFSAFDTMLQNDFLQFAYTLGVVGVIFYITTKGMGWQRKARQYHIKENDTEAKTITPEQLSYILDFKKTEIQQALEKTYGP